MNRLQEKYVKEIRPELIKKHNYKSTMECPKVAKIVINMGVGDATSNSKALDDAVADLTILSGQKPVITKAKKSIATFKLREGQAIGCKVTLRGERMYEFLERLVTASIPRIRDFRGINDKGFDGKGNYTFGIAEQIIFPEIDIDKIDRIQGMDITFVTSAQTDKEAMSLLKEFGLPFKNQQK